MQLNKFFKSNRGSALIVALMIVITMSLLGVAIMVITMSGLGMNIFYSDLNKAYYFAEAGVEQVAKVLDEKVAAIHESSRTDASAYIQDLLQNDPITVRTTSGNDGSVNYAETSLKFNDKYIQYYNSRLITEFGDANTLPKMKELLGTTSDDGIYAYKDIDTNGTRIVLESAQFDSLNHKIKVKVKGAFNGYKKTLEVTFNLSTELISQYSQAPYKVSVKSKVMEEPDVPSVFRKAIIAEKNLISVGGTVNIAGDVLCFGTVPVDISNQEDQTAPWYEYGGIMAGITPEVAALDTVFGFDSTKTGMVNTGSINITGNAATMAYIHSLYGTRAIHSDISITGNTFARAIRLEEPSNFSLINLTNAYTTDNLQIDSHASTVNVTGNYYGFVDAGYMIDGSGNNTSEKQLKDTYQFKRTSSIAVNGDSMLNLKGSVYVGGSTFLKDYTDEDGRPYMTGISAIKSSKRISSAYKEGDFSNPSNTLFWHENNSYSYPQPSYKKYSNDGNAVNMLSGRVDYPDQGYFPVTQRAMHFKGVWESLWKNDIVYSSYVNSQNITITGNGISTDGKLKGFSNGAIAANGTIYGIYDFEEGHDPVVFHAIQDQCIIEFHNAIQDLLMESYVPDNPRLDYTYASKHITDYVDMRFQGENRIVPGEPYVSSLDPDKGMVYYGTGNVEIRNEGGNWYIGSKLIPYLKGIIYVDGNVYVNGGFNFTGVIMCTGNVVFLGNSNITYDEAVVNGILGADVNIKGFFKLLTYDIPNEPLERQRIETKNIKIEQWKEVS
ncbi:MAG: pilus assembly PilX N-terminal domain-containing protein [Clostridia bacterium]|nr:pilus assembly PilX N-terminal domain-containing protein [Clostridia bacterium]